MKYIPIILLIALVGCQREIAAKSRMKTWHIGVMTFISDTVYTVPLRLNFDSLPFLGCICNKKIDYSKYPKGYRANDCDHFPIIFDSARQDKNGEIEISYPTKNK